MLNAKLNPAETPEFQDADKAREFLEAQRWPDGPVCPHCDCTTAYKLTPKPSKKDKHVRPGVYKCKGCEQQFTVTVNTIFEDSHIPLNKWLLAIHLLCASKKGMSAHQLHRMLGVTYKSAWFMAHRIRYMMSQPSFKNKLRGTVECDETYVGGRRRNVGKGRPGVNSHKQAVFSVVQRNGDVRSFHVQRVTGENLLGIIRKNLEKGCVVMTDGFTAYEGLDARFKAHRVIQHNTGEYSRKEHGMPTIHTNTVEGVFSLLKRGLTGVYHQVGEHHLHRYLSEFDFRYNARKISDTERTLLAISQAEGKRLQLRESSESPTGVTDSAS
jgi:transposase-like protein